jgi:hypothetical protein
MIHGVNPPIALGVLASTAATDAAYVVLHCSGQRPAPGVGGELERDLDLLSAFAVISYTANAIYVFEAGGSWLGFVSVSWLRRSTWTHNP